MNLSNQKYTKLNLACGPKQENKFPLPWLNVDCAGDVADFHSDIQNLPDNWSDFFEEVRASHVLEHFFLDQMDKVVAEWVRVLQPGGMLMIIVPDLQVILDSLNSGSDYNGRSSVSIDTTTAALAQVYGVGYDSSLTNNHWRHRFMFNTEMLTSLLSKQYLLEDIVIYSKSDDYASRYSIDDDSQNKFSLCISAKKKQ